jgi:hypothetical protein
MAGRTRNVLRVLAAVAFVVLVAAGCGGSAGLDRSAARGVPRVLASEWARQASAVAGAAAAGDSCRAAQLAAALRTDVIAQKSRVPARLRPPLLSGVNALADRIVCRPPPTTMPEKNPPKPHEPPKHDHHDHHKHGDNHGDGG